MRKTESVGLAKVGRDQGPTRCCATFTLFTRGLVQAAGESDFRFSNNKSSPLSSGWNGSQETCGRIEKLRKHGLGGSGIQMESVLIQYQSPGSLSLVQDFKFSESSGSDHSLESASKNGQLRELIELLKRWLILF